MWHTILALPIWAKISALVIFALGALWAWIKRKAIIGMTGAATDAAESELWGVLAKRIYAAAPPPTPPPPRPRNERTYRGTFDAILYHKGPPREHLLRMLDGSTTIMVPIMETQLLNHLRRGDLVEIDTVQASVDTEAVQRVRIVEPRK